MYTKIYPLGERLGLGSYDTFYDTEKYNNIEEAIKNNDCVIANFVSDENSIIYFEVMDSKYPDKAKYHCLNIQHFPFGVDISDDESCVELVNSFLNE